MTDYSPSLKAARLFEKISAKGNVYFTGRLGALRLTLLKSSETGDDGSPIWNLLMSEAPPKHDGGTAITDAAPRSSSSAARDWQRPPERTSPAVADTTAPKQALPDEIPF